ncbi:MAG: glycogen/starch/alpha-glucan phosphorylase [Burkholderiales bacterium]|nr:glycogen/starch/alpha-glucan phosphorylase [Burkholderiales bacterium]
MEHPHRESAQSPGREDIRTGLTEETIRLAFLDNLLYVQGRFPEVATVDDRFKALAYTVRDRILRRWMSTIETYQRANPRTVCYLSAEYLPGPFLGSNLQSLGIEEDARRALAGLGIDLEDLIEHEEEPGLGNGGLGRLAACFMDSLASLQVPATGYGIRYEYGIFTQLLRGGEQIEIADNWLRLGNPWEVQRPQIAYDVKIGGHTERFTDGEGRLRVRWVPQDVFRGMAIDTAIVGHRVNTVNLLRLWAARAPEGFDFLAFNRGDYYGAVLREIRSETISKVLYPNDEGEAGKRLRLLQQYFFVTCSLQDMLRVLRSTGMPPERFHDKFCVQLNDTHPAVAVAELMRLLVDECCLDWDAAWRVTRHTFAYTNHTLLPEALEKWPLELFQSVLPRHLEIIYEINARFLDWIRRRYPKDEERVRRVSVIDETPPRFVRMAHLACIGSFAINGVAQIHSRLLAQTVLRDFHEIWPQKFQNKTNGVTPRRFVMLSNPRLAALFEETLGPGWERDPDRLQGLERHADDPGFQERWRAIRRGCKETFAALAARHSGVRLDPATLFDVQAKRIHEYKRQHLNLLHVVTLYERIRRDPSIRMTPRSFIFGGKAAPGYAMAKLIIRLISAVGETVNRDPLVAGRLTVVFLPDFSVKLGHALYPAADLSEQISTAGKEASGTGNMKFAMNGALTIGTLDGANIEMREALGAENFFLFGLTESEVARTLAAGYRPWEHYESNPELKRAIDLIAEGAFSQGERGAFQPLVDHLLRHDSFLLLADYPSYIACQERAGAAFLNERGWTRMSILNAARMGRFSSDRTIGEYCRDIWRVEPLPVAPPDRRTPRPPEPAPAAISAR